MASGIGVSVGRGPSSGGHGCKRPYPVGPAVAQRRAPRDASARISEKAPAAMKITILTYLDQRGRDRA